MSYMRTDEALAYFLPTRTDDRRADLLAALREATKRRVEGPQATAAVIKAVHDELHMSYSDIEAASFNPEVGVRIDDETARRLVQRLT